ncbi:MAG: tryptophan synthase subunit alpha [Gammaproteobacteria bacterium]
MSRLKTRFEDCKSAGRKALIPYITAGDPNPSLTVPLLHALVEAGADVLELGVPFSDPMADGPVIQQACERALVHHVSLADVLDLVREFRRSDSSTPVVLMGYLNPIEVYGYERFAADAKAAGVDGILTVDLPPEEAGGLRAALDTNELDPIFLIAPTSTEFRLRAIAEAARGFVYYVSLKGVTGSANLDVDAVAAKLAEIRQFTDLPIGVGFGIRDGQSAAAVSQVSDAVVVGSSLVRAVAEAADDEARLAAAKTLIGEMRQAMDA